MTRAEPALAGARLRLETTIGYIKIPSSGYCMEPLWVATYPWEGGMSIRARDRWERSIQHLFDKDQR